MRHWLRWVKVVIPAKAGIHIKIRLMRFLLSAYPTRAILKLDEMPTPKKDINVRLLRLRWLVSAGRWQEAFAYIQEIRAELSPLEQRLYTAELDWLTTVTIWKRLTPHATKRHTDESRYPQLWR
jgi:hypothetical protein